MRSSNRYRIPAVLGVEVCSGTTRPARSESSRFWFVAFVLATPGCRPFADLESSASRIPAAKRCGECHVEIFAEWERSSHALAYTSPVFQARTDEGSVDRCISCHAPGPFRDVAALGRPESARTVNRDDGVTCVSCHHVEAMHGENPEEVDSAARMIGPHSQTALVDPHPIEARAEWFHDSAFCGRCHEDTYRESSEQQTGSASSTCQSCHMRPVSRRITQATGLVSHVLVAFEDTVDGRRHDFDVSAALEAVSLADGLGIADVELRTDGQSIVVVVRNRLPHSIPTGIFGSHEVRLSIESEGEMLAERVFVAKASRALLSGATVELRIMPKTGARTIEVVWRRSSAPNSTTETMVLDRRVVALPLAGELPDAFEGAKTLSGHSELEHSP